MPTDLTLYRVEDDLAALMDTVDLTPDEQRDEILAAIAKTTEAAVEKRDRVAAFIRHMELQIDGVDKEIERLKTLRERWQNGKQQFERYVIAVIEAFVPEPKRGPKKLEGRLSVLSLAKNPDSVEITGAVPDEYCDVRVKLRGEQFRAITQVLSAFGEDGLLQSMYDGRDVSPRKAEIKRAIERGEDVPGADIKYGANRLVVK